MTLSTLDSEEAVRTEVQAWLDVHFDPDIPLGEWRQILADSGWGVPTWPVEWYGKGISRGLAQVVAQEFVRVGAAGPPWGIGTMLTGPVLFAHGTETQKRKYIRRILTGEDIWCQLFSEPGAGSDLAGLRTRAEMHGGEWIVNGQKVWSSAANVATHGILVARTDWDRPKHQGLSFFLIDMKQPGVEARPLRQMNREASFCETFFTDARIPKENLVGEVNGGWAVALTTLANERYGTAGPPGLMPRKKGRQQERVPSARSWIESTKKLARDVGRASDPVVRQQIAYVWSLRELSRLNTLRARALAAAGRAGSEGSIGKLWGSTIRIETASLNMALLGAAATLEGEDAPLRGSLQQDFLSYPSLRIAGGTDEVQLNIIGERVLGLPKEPQIDKDVPFRDVRGGR